MPRLTARDILARRKLRELKRCQKSSWYLATKYLGYEWNPVKLKGLTERVHKPIMDWRDRHALEGEFIGLWMARKRHKTTMVVTWLIQEILRDPTKSHLYFHAVDEQAEDFVLEVGLHFASNEKLRWLDPIGEDHEGKRYKVCPGGKSKRWLKTGSFTINRHLRYGAGTRAPTLRAKGAGSEVTGAHIDGCAFLDDIIARKTIENSELQKIQRWYQNTVFPIVDSDRIMCTGTPWSEQSVHQIWQTDPDWHTLVIPGSIVESDEEYRRLLEAA